VARDDGHERPVYLGTRGEWLAHPRWLSGEEVLFVKMHEGLFAASLTGAVRALFRGPVWHPAASPDGSLAVFDTRDPDMGLVLVSVRTCRWRVLCHPRSTAKGHRWAELSPAPGPWSDPSVMPGGRMVDWDAETAYGPEWTHPHPVFSADGRGIFFTSDISGHPQVYLAEIPGGWAEELTTPS
jgi:oligogalacturonide lyase